MDKIVEDKRQEIRDVFGLFDTNGNGSIDFGELSQGLRCLGLNPTSAEIISLMQKFDLNKDQNLTFEEFGSLYLEYSKDNVDMSKEIEDQFRKLDTSGDGRVDIEELRKVLMHGDDKLTEAEVEEVIQDFDKNGDGIISLEEFIAKILGNK